MNDELKRWIADTEDKAAEANARAAIMLEAAKRAREGEDPREFVLYFGKPLDYLTSWTDIRTSTYTLKPPRRLRPWTAKEWGARIGDEFISSTKKRRLILASVCEFNDGLPDHVGLQFREIDEQGVWSFGTGSAMQSFTQLDGSPCGEWEEVQP